MIKKKFKIALINPNWIEESIENIAALPDFYPPTGLGTISTVLKNNGYNVKFYDMPLFEYSIQALIFELGKYIPDVICITCVTTTYLKVKEISKQCKKSFPSAKIIIGGPHITLDHSNVVKETCVDLSVAGPGEFPLLKLCDSLRNGIVDHSISGVGYHDGSLTVNLPDNNDNSNYLAIDYELFDLDNYKRKFNKMYILTSRGCNGKCIFCAAGRLYPKIYFRPLNMVLYELMFLVRDIGFEFLNIYDSNFTFNKERVHRICDFIIKNKLKIKWRCFSENKGLDVELLSKMRQAGCSHILFGVESSHDKTLQLVGKRHRRNDVINAFKLSHEVGIKPVAYSIVGLPGETEIDILDTINFIEDIKPSWNVISPISLFPGTKIYDDPQKYNLKLENDITKGARGIATVSSKDLSTDKIESLTNHALKILNKGETYYDWVQHAD